MTPLKKGQHYRITVEKLAEPNAAVEGGNPMQFEVTDHEDIFDIVERLRKQREFDDDAACALGVGMRLFGNVMLQNKGDPRFAGLMPHFREFMQGMKKALK